MDDFYKTQVIIPMSLKKSMENSAKEACRSLPKEILYRLTQYEKGMQINATTTTNK